MCRNKLPLHREGCKMSRESPRRCVNRWTFSRKMRDLQNTFDLVSGHSYYQCRFSRKIAENDASSASLADKFWESFGQIRGYQRHFQSWQLLTRARKKKEKE